MDKDRAYLEAKKMLSTGGLSDHPLVLNGSEVDWEALDFVLSDWCKSYESEKMDRDTAYREAKILLDVTGGGSNPIDYLGETMVFILRDWVRSYEYEKES